MKEDIYLYADSLTIGHETHIWLALCALSFSNPGVQIMI